MLDLDRLFSHSAGEPPAWSLECERLRDGLRQTVRLRTQLDDLERALVRRLRREYFLTWRELGEDLGVTGQTAHRRHASALRR